MTLKIRAADDRYLREMGTQFPLSMTDRLSALVELWKQADREQRVVAIEAVARRTVSVTDLAAAAVA